MIKNHKRLIIFTIAILFAVLTIARFGAGMTARAAGLSVSPVTASRSECQPGEGWKWADGPDQPLVAEAVRQELSLKGLSASVRARSYGELDSCDTFSSQGLDFWINMADPQMTSRNLPQNLSQEIYPILTAHGGPRLGNVKIQTQDGEVTSLDFTAQSAPDQGARWQPAANGGVGWEQPPAAMDLPAGALTKKVYVIVYDPILSSGKRLSEQLHWYSHATLTQGTVDLFKQTSQNLMNYTVVDTTVVSAWPEKIDGFVYSEAQYLSAASGQSSWHQPDAVNYNKIVDSTQFDICGKLNRGEIDEVWIYNGPGFGFYESTLAGPGAYWFNSPPVSGPNNCNRLVPIMGPSPERGLACAIENFGHRTESTMVQVYGSWQQNRTAHSWEKFALVKAKSPSYSYSGCGNVHYPPNGTSDYDYGNPSTVQTNCDDFANYPNLSSPLTVVQPVTCTLWSCDHLQYFRYWFGHLPHNAGCGPDNVSNNWWRYFGNPVQALTPSDACAPITTFSDVPSTYWAYSYIDRLYNAGITTGCGYGIYCPENSVTRAEMAVFLLRGMHGRSYAPPAVGAGTGFTDVPVGYWADKWVKQLAAEGITNGCGVGRYCPDATVTRAEMAVFLLRAKHTSSYTPPSATGVFTDVPVGYWADKWIEQLALEGITSGCGVGTYCPDSPATRAQMAIFLVRTFNLP